MKWLLSCWAWIVCEFLINFPLWSDLFQPEKYWHMLIHEPIDVWCAGYGFWKRLKMNIKFIKGCKNRKTGWGVVRVEIK